MRRDYLEFNAIEKGGEKEREKKPVNGLDFPKSSGKQGLSADCSLSIGHSSSIFMASTDCLH